MKQRFIIFFAALSILGSTLVSCDPDKVDNLYTFTDKLLGNYLIDNKEYSEFARLLDTTQVMGLLNSYGSYTVFAPDNKAMSEFYALKGKKNIVRVLNGFIANHCLRPYYQWISDNLQFLQ